MRRSGKWLGVVVAGALVAGCTSGGPEAEEPRGVSVSADGVAAHLSAFGWDVTLNGEGPADSVLTLAPSDEVAGAEAAEEALDAVRQVDGVRAGEPVHVELEGGELPAEGARLERRLDEPVPDDARISLAYYDPGTGAWTAVPTTLSDDRRTVSAEVEHFSFWTEFAGNFTYGMGWLLDTRVTPPSCEGEPPAWVERDDLVFVDDKNGPLRWCVGRDPADEDVLVVKVAVNRAYGAAVTPRATPAWAWNSIFQGGPEDVLVKVMTGAIRLPGGWGKGSMLVAGGTEAHFGFTEKAVRAAGGNPLVEVRSPTEYLVAGLTYTGITKILGKGDGPAAALVTLLGVAQCGTTFSKAVAADKPHEATKAALVCLESHADDISRALATALASMYPDRSERSLGQLAGRVGGKLWQLWAAGIVFGVGTWYADGKLGKEIWRLSAFPEPVEVGGVTRAAMASAPVPSVCGHPAGKLTDGVLVAPGEDAGTTSLGDVHLGNLDGDPDREAAVVLMCDLGGNAVMFSAHVYDGGPPRHVGVLDVAAGRDVSRAWDVSLSSVRIVDGTVIVDGLDGDEDDVIAGPSVHLSTAFRLSGGAVVRVAPTPPSDADSFSIDGWGSWRIGDTYWDAARATGWPMDVDTLFDEPDPTCTSVGALGGPDRSWAVGDGERIASIVLTRPGPATPSGIRVGDSLAEVLAAYADADLERVRNEYHATDDVVVSAGSDGRVIRFQFDDRDRVGVMHNGERDYALLPEGCL